VAKGECSKLYTTILDGVEVVRDIHISFCTCARYYAKEIPTFTSRVSRFMISAYHSVKFDYSKCIHGGVQLKAPHKSMPYIRHYFPRVLVSRKRIKLSKNPF